MRAIKERLCGHGRGTAAAAGAETGGRILQNGSIAVFIGAPVPPHYVAAKTAIDSEGFTKSLVARLDPEWDIKVESLCNVLII
ncbi:hypothetical protein SCP_0605090 [Sparassis crispa]|uniref:Uncharacterized protein n=1 Tax=Sparassis crispa TaxID=139825 RepID=A0A401GQT7_9APHY|nr:hypothetical protein SCP_0605090 [Sparassis crispa]GBE84530.1 hypothetical protein SCP_0605090 [Sparassis crispa]